MKVTQVRINVYEPEYQGELPKRTWRSIIACWIDKHEWCVEIDEQKRVEVIKDHEHGSLAGISIKCSHCGNDLCDVKRISMPEALGVSLLVKVKTALADQGIMDVMKMRGEGGMLQ